MIFGNSLFKKAYFLIVGLLATIGLATSFFGFLTITQVVSPSEIMQGKMQNGFSINKELLEKINQELQDFLDQKEVICN